MPLSARLRGMSGYAYFIGQSVMEIKGPGNFSTLNLTDLRQLAVTAAKTGVDPARLNWQTGQLLNALVLRQDTNTLLLDIQGQPVLVKNRPEFAFLPGQKLTLQVSQMQPELALKLIDPVPRPISSAEQQVFQQTLRQDLTRQAPLTPLLANLHSVARQPQQHPPLPAAIRKAAWEIHQLLPESRQVGRGDSLQQALERTGPFLQHLLLQTARGETAPVPEKTLQGALLRLADQIRQQLALPAPRQTSSPGRGEAVSPQGATMAGGAAGSAIPVRSDPAQPSQGVRPQTAQAQPQQAASLQGLLTLEQGLGELLRQVEGGLARMQLHQLHSLQADQGGRPMWAMELPVRSEQGIDLFDLRICQQEPESGDAEYQRPWSVSLAFDLEGLGPVVVNLTLIDQRVSARFQMQEDATRDLFDNALEQLRSRLRGVGLEVGRLECATGMQSEDKAPAHSGLLDEKA